MKHILLIFTMIAGLLLATPAFSASSKSKYNTFSKSYKNARLEQVIKDVQAKTGYQIKYEAEDLDLNKPITAQFKKQSARAVLRKVLDKDMLVSVKKGVITISKKPAPPQEIKVTATVPSRVEEDSIYIISIYEDTTFSIQCKTVSRELPTKQVEQPKKTDKGHYIQGYAGLGYSRLGYSPARAKDAAKGGLGATIGFNYAYYFHENWGVSAGIGFDYYGDKGVINDVYEWPGQGDSDGEQYTHRVYGHDWSEKQRVGTVNVPIGIQTMYPLSNKENALKLYGGAGLQIGLPVLKSFSLAGGKIEHRGWYPQWQMEMHDQTDRDFYYEGTDAFDITDNKLHLSSIAIGVFADLGVAIPVAEQWDVMVGAFAKVTCNNMYAGEGKALGWRNDQASQADGVPRQHTFMEQYTGLVNSAEVDAVRPWMVGIKVGFNWHHQRKPQEVLPEYERIQVCDTTITLSERRETELKPQPEAAKKIVKLMQRSVIWFDLDSWEPKLKPADIIDKIAAILIENPEQHILVNGHASKEGNDAHNQMLSSKRAQAIVNLLVEKGVNPAQITSNAYGSTVEYNDEDEDMTAKKHNISLDRRVEIIPIQ